MRTRRALAFEVLESRSVLSADVSQVAFMSSELDPGGIPNDVPPLIGDDVGASEQSTVLSTPASTRWDWLAGTSWYVLTENLLAYSAPQNLSDPTPIADQTIWNITQSSDGVISGESVTKLSSLPFPTTNSIVGVVTEAGQVRLHFENSGVTGVGQLRFVEGQWRVQMQMVTSSSEIVAHWAYMSQLLPGTTPPDPSDPSPPGSFRSDEWHWLVGTDWILSDSTLFAGGSHRGVFGIESFHNGYFWGSGTSNQPFNVLGSITPEGNVLLAISVNGASPQTRMGMLSVDMMLLRTYEDQPAVGSAWQVGSPLGPSSRLMMTSSLEATGA
jgi:hypothetical protein